MYWRRRFLVLAGVLALAWGTITLWPAGGESEAPAPRASATAPASQEPTPAAQEEETGTPDDTTVTLATGEEACDPESIRMSPQVPPDQTVEATVTIQLVISTTASKPCTFTPKAGDVAALVAVGDTAVWDSEVCTTAALIDDPVALSPRWSTVATATWSGRGSGPVCAKDEGWASPGKYALRIGTLGGEPGKTTFRLAEKPAEKKPEPKDEPEGDEEPEPEDTADDA